MTPAEMARRRLRNQRLVGAPFGSAAEAVGALLAVQAQDYAGAKWAIGQRVRGATDAAVEAAFDRGDLLRTHVLRPTWHAVTPADIRWLLALTAPRVKAASAYYARQRKLDARTFARANDVLARALEGGKQRTRDELAVALAAGIAASGERLAHILIEAELDAVVCSGARRGKQFTYALFDERVPTAPPVPREQALAEIARRYFAGHGPARPADLSWWSGLTIADANVAIAAAGLALEEVAGNGLRTWLAPAKAPARSARPVVHLLPNYDELLIAYKVRDVGLDPELVHRVGPNSTMFANHIVIRDGVVIGGWRRVPVKGGMQVALRLLAKLTRAEEAALAVSVDRYRRFLGCQVTVTRS